MSSRLNEDVNADDTLVIIPEPEEVLFVKPLATRYTQAHIDVAYQYVIDKELKRKRDEVGENSGIGNVQIKGEQSELKYEPRLSITYETRVRRKLIGGKGSGKKINTSKGASKFKKMHVQDFMDTCKQEKNMEGEE